MSTAPSTSSAVPVSYTVIGGSRWDRVRRYPHELTFLVLSRGDRLFRGALLAELQATGIGEILWIGGPDVSYDLESHAREFPDVRFLVLSGPASPGERVNVGISEARARREHHPAGRHGPPGGRAPQQRNEHRRSREPAERDATLADLERAGRALPRPATGDGEGFLRRGGRGRRRLRRVARVGPERAGSRPGRP